MRLERQFAVYHGHGKGWRLASPRLLPLPGGRAGPLLGLPVAKRVKSGASKSVNSGNLLDLSLPTSPLLFLAQDTERGIRKRRQQDFLVDAPVPFWQL
jgi:hypothetical protein